MGTWCLLQSFEEASAVNPIQIKNASSKCHEHWYVAACRTPVFAFPSHCIVCVCFSSLMQFVVGEKIKIVML